MVLKKEVKSSGWVWIVIALIFIVVASVIGYNYVQFKKEQSLLKSFELTYYSLKDRNMNEKEEKDLINKLDEKFKNECENNKCSVREIYFYVSAQQRLGVSDKIMLEKEFLKNTMIKAYEDSFDISNSISEDSFFSLILMHRLEQFRKVQVDFWRERLSSYKYNDLFDRFKQTLLLRTFTNGVSSYDLVEKMDNKIKSDILSKNICTDIPSYSGVLNAEQVSNPDDNALAPVYNYAYVKSFCKSGFNDNDKALFDKIANKDYPTVYGSIQKDIIINIGIKGLF